MLFAGALACDAAGHLEADDASAPLLHRMALVHCTGAMPDSGGQVPVLVVTLLLASTDTDNCDIYCNVYYSCAIDVELQARCVYY